MTSSSSEEIAEICEPEWLAQEEAWLHERAATLPDHDTRVQRYRFIVRQLRRPLDVSAPPSFARLIAKSVEGEMRARQRLMGRFEIAALAGLATLCVAGVVFSGLSPVSTRVVAEQLAGTLRMVAGSSWLMALGGCLGITLATSVFPRRLGGRRVWDR
jgi:hypothetical protein